MRDPTCQCGSGAHPRRCEKHPDAYDAHVTALNTEAQEDAIDAAIDEAYDEHRAARKRVRD